MHRRKKKFDFLQMVADSDPEMAEVVTEIREDYASGRNRDQPWRWDQCRSWLDAWLYVFRRVDVDYHQHLYWEKDTVMCAVWPVIDFNDTVVDWLERFQARLGTDADLQELRLIDTAVSEAGIARLRGLFPSARISKYTEGDVEKEPKLAFAKS